MHRLHSIVNLGYITGCPHLHPPKICTRATGVGFPCSQDGIGGYGRFPHTEVHGLLAYFNTFTQNHIVLMYYKSTKSIKSQQCHPYICVVVVIVISCECVHIVTVHGRVGVCTCNVSSSRAKVRALHQRRQFTCHVSGWMFLAHLASATPTP